MSSFVRRLFFCGTVVFHGIFLTGCMQTPGAFETLDDFRRKFLRRDSFPVQVPEGVLSLKKAVETALLNNPSNLAAAQAVLAAGYGYRRALSAYAPEINVSYSVGHTLSRGWDLKNPPVGVMKKNDHFVTEGTLHATLLLFDGFARELETIIAKEEYNKSRAAEKNVRRLLERAVAYAYYDMLLAGEEIIINGEDLDFQKSALQQAEVRFRNGHVSKASVLNFKILAARAESNISSARYRRRVAFHALCALMGCPPRQLPENVVLQPVSTDLFPQLYNESFYLELAICHRPDLKMEKIALNIAYRNRQKAFASFFPEIRLFSELSLATYNADYGGYRVSDAHSRQGGFVYGGEITWNLFKGWDTVNKVRQQKVLEKIAMWGLNTAFLEIAAEIRDARANCQNARYQTRIFRDMAQWVREQRDLVFSEYLNGRETITRLNEAQSTLIEAQRKLAVSAIESNKAAAQLAAAAGIGLPQLRP